MEQFAPVKRSKDGQPVRYLIVDDSVFARKNLARMSVGTLSNGYLTSDNFLIPLPKIQTLRGWLKGHRRCGRDCRRDAFLLATYWFCLGPCQCQ